MATVLMESFAVITSAIGADAVVARVIPWVFFWHALFWLSVFVSPMLFSTYPTLDGPSKSYWASSMVSTIHAILICYLATIAAINLDILNSQDLFKVDESSSLANIVFISYLCSDLFLSLYYNKCWPGWQANVIHHVTGIWCWYILETGSFGHTFAIAAQLTEATTPFINQRYFFDKAGMKSSSLYLANGLLMTVLWFLLRVCMFGWVGFRLFVMRSELLSLSSIQLVTCLFSYTIGYSLQLFWFSKILKGALKAAGISGGKKTVKSGKKPMKQAD